VARRGLAAAPRHPMQHDRLAGLLAEFEKEKEKGPVPGWWHPFRRMHPLALTPRFRQNVSYERPFKY
jgi:hypothetical protein